MKKSNDMVKSLTPESREACDAVPRFDFDLSSRWVSGIPYEWRSGGAIIGIRAQGMIF